MRQCRLVFYCINTKSGVVHTTNVVSIKLLTVSDNLWKVLVYYINSMSQCKVVCILVESQPCWEDEWVSDDCNNVIIIIIFTTFFIKIIIWNITFEWLLLPHIHHTTFFCIKLENAHCKLSDRVHDFAVPRCPIVCQWYCFRLWDLFGIKIRSR